MWLRPGLYRLIDTDPFIGGALVVPVIITVPHRGWRGARLARREKGAYGQYWTDEQRRQTGGIGANMGSDSCVGP